MKAFFCAVIGSSMCFAACTKVDDTFGDGMIPNDQQMAGYKDTVTTGIETFVVQDSIPATNIGQLLLGRTSSPVFGKKEASFIAQFFPGYFEDENVKFGLNPVVDSLVIEFAVNSYGGDTTVAQTFGIYEITKRPNYDSTYYNTVDIEGRFAPETSPVATFTHSGTGIVKIKLLGDNAFANRLVSDTIVDGTHVYMVDTLFYNTFKGLYIAPLASSPAAAAVYALNPGSEDTEMNLYFRNHDPEAPSQIKDTSHITYYFYHGTYTTNVSVNSIRYDYSGSQVTGVNDTVNVASKCFVQTQGGVVTYVRFSDDFVDELKGKINSQEGFRSMVLNKATLVVTTKDRTAAAYNVAPTRFGIYTDYVKFKGIKDYNYEYEQNGYEIPFDGYLSRSTGQYRMDITTYIQDMISEKGTQRGVYLGPDVSIEYNFLEGEIEGGVSGVPEPGNPFRVELIYTLIK